MPAQRRRSSAVVPALIPARALALIPARTLASIPARTLAPIPARTLAPILALTLSLALLAGCQDRKVKVEISAAGDATGRVFVTNQTDKASLEKAAALYGSKGERDEELGRKFSGTFSEGALPSEIGNRGAIGRLDSALGSARAYYEQFADRRDEWGAMRDRVEGGVLWMQLFGRFIERRKLKDDAARIEFSRWWNGEVIPLVTDAYLMYSGMQAVVQAQRIGAMPRRAEDFGSRTADEGFRISVFEPLAVLLAERGWLDANEFAAAQMIGLNGNFSRREREWASAKVFMPAISRIISRFDPSRKDMKLQDFVPLGIEFVLWLKISREYRDIVLESPAISPTVKEAVRAGKWEFELPPPFGFRVMERPKVTDAEVVLDTGAKPFFTNGVWNETTRRVEFKGGFYEGKYRYIPYNPPYYALWALPSQRQESCFGAVVLEGESLAEYCAWEAALDEPLRARWMQGLDALAATKDAAQAFALMVELADDHPMPLPLARWIAERAGKPLPDQFKPREERGGAGQRGERGGAGQRAPANNESTKKNEAGAKTASAS